jgi:trans-aconitate methyltransferase
MARLSRDAFDHFLVDAYLPLIPGLTEKLRSGARVADFACGSGHAFVVLARAFPNSTFLGYDLDEEALASGRPKRPKQASQI